MEIVLKLFNSSGGLLWVKVKDFDSKYWVDSQGDFYLKAGFHQIIDMRFKGKKVFQINI